MLRLPVEIWAMIAQDLPPSSKISCLSVSRLFHDIAIRPLFSMIRLYPFHRRTGDILDRIVIDTAFAGLVKSLAVIISGPESLVVLDTGKLAKAIESMSQLVSFQWIGRAVSFPEEVAEAIGSFCPQLRELALPVDDIVYHAPLLDLHNLRTLRLQFPYSRGSNASYHAHKFDLKGYLRMIDANPDTLRELHIISPYLDKVPVQVSDSLTHLEIYKPSEDDSSFQSLFCHANNLESLILVGDIGFEFPSEFPSVGQDTDILPRLSSLYLWSFVSLSEAVFPSIGNFIRDRVSLRRLSLDLCASWSEFEEILPIVKGLPGLRVLGLSIDRGDVDLEFLGRHLPSTLESFHLALCWNWHTSWSPHRVLMSLPSLTFLHIDAYNLLPLTTREMAHDMKHLRIVGRQGYLWDIVRTGNDETLVPWILVKREREWRVDGDFPDDDIAWLLKYY